MEEENRKPSKKVMVVIDDNECSYYAFMWVLNNLNESIKDRPLVVLAAKPPANCSYVVSSAPGFAMSCTISATMDLIKSAQEQRKKLMLGLLEKAKTVCESKGVNVEEAIAVDDVKEAVCRAIQKYNVDLIVAGEKADGTLKRAFQESISEYCTQNVNCPVLVVRKSV